MLRRKVTGWLQHVPPLRRALQQHTGGDHRAQVGKLSQLLQCTTRCVLLFTCNCRMRGGRCCPFPALAASLQVLGFDKRCAGRLTLPQSQAPFNSAPAATTALPLTAAAGALQAPLSLQQPLTRRAGCARYRSPGCAAATQTASSAAAPRSAPAAPRFHRPVNPLPLFPAPPAKNRRRRRCAAGT